jgi:hypothetical protein
MEYRLKLQTLNDGKLESLEEFYKRKFDWIPLSKNALFCHLKLKSIGKIKVTKTDHTT